MNVNLKAKPFYLSDEQIAWVNDTLAGMTDDDKIRHLFCLVAYNDDDEYCRYIARDVRPGGFMSRVMSAEQWELRILLLIILPNKFPMN